MIRIANAIQGECAQDPWGDSFVLNWTGDCVTIEHCATYHILAFHP